MNLKKENGFSLIELLVVVVIIGIIAAIAVPSLRKSLKATENSAAFSMMRTINQTQANYYTSKNRYARLDELNNSQNQTLTPFTPSATELVRGPFTYSLTSDSSDTALQTSYTIVAARAVPGDLPYVISVDSSGSIIQITP